MFHYLLFIKKNSLKIEHNQFGIVMQTNQQMVFILNSALHTQVFIVLHSSKRVPLYWPKGKWEKYISHKKNYELNFFKHHMLGKIN
jgi:hypothetical protein